MIYRVDPHQIDLVWEQVLPLLVRLMDTQGLNDFDTPQFVKNGVLYEKLQLWVLVEGDLVQGCVVTNIEQFPTGYKVLMVRYTVGNEMGKWIKYWDTIKQYAVDNGCHRMRGFNRKGWMKLLKEDVEDTYVWELKI